MTQADIERRTSLRQVLLDREHELRGDIAGRVRASRSMQGREVGDSLDMSDDDVRIGMDFTLLQIKTTMLAAITQALQRLDAGRYGDCTECGDAIHAKRLRAVPFAVRCQSCEQERETHQREQRVAPEASFGVEVSRGIRYDPA